MIDGGGCSEHNFLKDCHRAGSDYKRLSVSSAVECCISCAAESNSDWLSSILCLICSLLCRMSCLGLRHWPWSLLLEGYCSFATYLGFWWSACDWTWLCRSLHSHKYQHVNKTPKHLDVFGFVFVSRCKPHRPQCICCLETY